MNVPLKLQRTVDLDTILDQLEQYDIRIRYYRFYKVSEGYLFKTFLDRKNGSTNQFTGLGATRTEAVVATIENLKSNNPTISTYTRKYKKRIKNDKA